MSASWWHCDTKTMSRSDNRTAVAAAAYRMGESLYDERREKTQDYTRRSGVMDKFIIAPEDAPDWVYDTGRLWNEAERAEKTRINARFARETTYALPSFMDEKERHAIAKEFAEAISERYGVAVAVAIHSPGKGDDRNYHAHLMFTTREITPEGFGKKTRVLDDLKSGPVEFKKIQEMGADIMNRHLRAANSDVRVDHRSFDERGIDKEPTTHLGPTAAEMERKGKASDRGDINREAERKNREIEEKKAELAAAERAVQEEKARLAEPPSSREDAMERVREDAALVRGGMKAHVWTPGTKSPDALTWWQRAALHIAVKARSLAQVFSEKAKGLWQRRETDRSRGRERYSDRGIDR